MEQDNARFERSAEMFRDAKSRQMKQTNAILAGLRYQMLFFHEKNAIFYFRII